jgi:hypothetical protein
MNRSPSNWPKVKATAPGDPFAIACERIERLQDERSTLYARIDHLLKHAAHVTKCACGRTVYRLRLRDGREVAFNCDLEYHACRARHVDNVTELPRDAS